jgi:phage/plasmid-associated DNA primase
MGVLSLVLFGIPAMAADAAGNIPDLSPFDVTIPDDDCDRSLGNTLKAEGAGILNWMLQGLWDYKTNGLKVPQAIRAATAAYRSEQDLVGEWITDKCVTDAELREDKRSQYAAKLRQDKRELYSDYAMWAQTSGYKSVSQKRLTRQLGERGYKLDPGKREILGIVLRASCLRIPIPDSALKGSDAQAKTGSETDPDTNVIDWPGKRRASPDGGADRGAAAKPAAGADAGGARPSDEA